MCCHIHIDNVRKYVRHTENHQDTIETKATYMKEMRDNLSKLADSELVLDETREAKSRKRAGPDMNPNLHKARKPRLDFDTTIPSSSHSLHHGRTDPFQAPPSVERGDAALPYFSSTSTAAEKSIDNLAIMSEGLYSGSLAGVDLALDGFDASIHQLVNFPESWRAAYPPV